MNEIKKSLLLNFYLSPFNNSFFYCFYCYVTSNFFIFFPNLGFTQYYTTFYTQTLLNFSLLYIVLFMSFIINTLQNALTCFYFS